MGSFTVFRRSDESSVNPTILNLLIALVILLIVTIVLLVTLYALRRRRVAAKEAGLPLYSEKASTRNSRRLTINARATSIHVYEEKQNLIGNSSSPPTSPVPEIRITFPDEVDETGKTQSGKVVVVRVGEHSVGLEPLPEKEYLPAYQQDERFQSLDLDRIGGLKEKEMKP